MRLPSNTALLLNGAAALIVVASVVSMGRSMIIGNEPASCRERYADAIQWSLQRDNGALLSNSDLQARLGGTDWGVVERVSVVSADHASGAALAIDLASRTAASQPNGAGFEWAPQSVGRVGAACVSYAFKLDPEFDFAAGGRLPGLLGGPMGSDRSTPEAFSTRLAWDADGRLDIHGHMPGASSPRALRNERDPVVLPRGRWVSVDQEVVVNTPGRSDGVVRVWIDGRLRFESRNAAFRTDSASGIHGVLAEVAYARPLAKSNAASSVLVTPFEYRW